MSFPTDPDLYSFATAPPTCSVCYAANKTPVTIFAQFTGIQIGDDWNPGDPPPPNGLFELTITSDCQWTLTTALYDFTYTAADPALPLIVDVIGVANAYNALIPVSPCTTETANTFSTPAGRHYFGGTGVALNPLESGARNNIELMDLLNLQPAIRTFCNPQAIDTDVLSTRYTLRNGSTNIYIKYDFT